MRKIPVYSCQPGAQDKPLRYETPGRALAMLTAGEARYVRGDAIVLVGIERRDITSPSGIPAHTMFRAAAGDPHAAAKVREWGALQAQNFRRMVGQPAEAQ